MSDNKSKAERIATIMWKQAGGQGEWERVIPYAQKKWIQRADAVIEAMSERTATETPTEAQEIANAAYLLRIECQSTLIERMRDKGATLETFEFHAERLRRAYLREAKAKFDSDRN